VLCHRVAIFVALAALLSTGSARAYIYLPTVPSVEVVVGEADAIVVGRVRAVTAEPLRVPRLMVEVDVERVITGRPVASPARVELVVEPPRFGDLGYNLGPQSGDEVVLGIRGLLADFGNARQVPQARGWVLRDGRPIDLTPAVTMDGEYLPHRAALVAAVEREVAANRHVSPVQTLWAPVVPPAVGQRLGGRGLQVPADARLDMVAARWARHADPGYRSAAAHLFSRRPWGAGRLAALRPLMADAWYGVDEQGVWRPQPADRWRRIFPARAGATQAVTNWIGSGTATGDETRALHALLHDVRPVTEPHPTYRPVGYGALVRGAIVIAGAIGTASLARRRGGRLGVARVGAAAAVVAALAVLVLDRKSRTDESTASFALGAASWEVTAVDGRLHVLRVADESAPRGVVVRDGEGPLERWAAAARATGFPGEGLLSPAVTRPWFGRLLTEAAAPPRQALGATLSSGTIAGVGKKTYEYRLVFIPLWWAAAVIGSWPVLVLTAAAWRAWRVRRRARAGRCGACGYDLRGAGPGGRLARCPECGGRAVARAPAGKRGARRVLAGVAALSWCAAVGTVAHANIALPLMSLVSVEAAPYACEAIVRGRVVSHGPRVMQVDVTDVLWGMAAERVPFELRHFVPANCPPGAEVVVALRDRRRQAGGVWAVSNPRVDELSSAAVWLIGADGRIAADVPAVRVTGQVLATRDELVAALLAEAARARRSPGVELTRLDGGSTLPPSLAARVGPRLWRVGLTVPKNDRLEAAALAWARHADADYRLAGVMILATFPPTPDAERAVRAALADPAADVVPAEWEFGLAARGTREFRVRQAAVRTLRAWSKLDGVSRHAWLDTSRQLLLMNEPYPRYGPVRWHGIVACALGAAALGACAGRRGRSAARRALSAVLWLAAAGAGWMGWRGGSVVDSVAWADGRAQWEVVSSAGQLAVLRVERPAPDDVQFVLSAPPTPVAATFPSPAGPLRSGLAPVVPGLAIDFTETGGARWAGARVARGTYDTDMPDPAGIMKPFQFPYRLIVIPWAWVAALPALPLAIGLLLSLRRRLRNRSRVKRGRCVPCGYDLRSGAVGGRAAARCPECGARGVVVVRPERRPATAGGATGASGDRRAVVVG